MLRSREPRCREFLLEIAIHVEPPRRSHHRDGKCEVIIGRVMEKSTTGIVYLMLTRMNYTEWSVVMRVNLQAVGVWEAVRHGGIKYHDNKHVLAALLHVEPVDMQAGLANKETAHGAWGPSARFG
jgi:hypothetical protein